MRSLYLGCECQLIRVGSYCFADFYEAIGASARYPDDIRSCRNPAPPRRPYSPPVPIARPIDRDGLFTDYITSRPSSQSWLLSYSVWTLEGGPLARPRIRSPVVSTEIISDNFSKWVDTGRLPTAVVGPPTVDSGSCDCWRRYGGYEIVDVG